MGHPQLVFLHVLLFVFWLGADVGVFIAGLWFLNPALSIDQRGACIRMAMVIDRFPRVCFVLMAPVGVSLARQLGLLPIGDAAMAGVWLADLVWLAAALNGMLRPEAAITVHTRRVEFAFQAAGLAVFAGGGAWALARGLEPAWLAGKLIAYGAICACSILLERSFAPVTPAFVAIATEGSTPEREARLRRAMTMTYVWVVSLYVALLVAGYLGVVKPG